MNQQGAVPKIHQSMDAPPIGHEPPQSRPRNPIAPFGPAGQYRSTNDRPWRSHPATAKGVGTGARGFCARCDGSPTDRSGRIHPCAAELSADHQPGIGRGAARPKAHRRQTVLRSLVGAVNFLGTTGWPKGHAEAGFNSVHFTERARRINVTLVALVLSAVATHLATAYVRLGEGLPSTKDERLHELQRQELCPYGPRAHGWDPAVRPSPNHALATGSSWVPPIGRSRPGCWMPRCRANRETADSCLVGSAKWSPPLQMMIGKDRGRSGTLDS